jgi:hypothetical protein
MSDRPAAFLTALLLAILSAPAMADPSRHVCDVLAASPNDNNALAPAVGPEVMNVEGAIQACLAALHEFPDTPRFEAQLANALFVAQRYDEAVEWFRRAAGTATRSACIRWDRCTGVERDCRKTMIRRRHGFAERPSKGT